MAAVPLRRNRDFVLLQSGQLFSSVGSESTAIAYPLLVLAVTGSPAKAGLVAAARVVPFALFGVLAGMVADRYDRKRVMIAADAMRALAVAAPRRRSCTGRPTSSAQGCCSRSSWWATGRGSRAARSGCCSQPSGPAC